MELKDKLGGIHNQWRRTNMKGDKISVRILSKFRLIRTILSPKNLFFKKEYL